MLFISATCDGQNILSIIQAEPVSVYNLTQFLVSPSSQQRFHVLVGRNAHRWKDRHLGIFFIVQAFIAPDKLHTAAFLSCLSGMAHRSNVDLAAELEGKGMQLIASGHNMYTR